MATKKKPVKPATKTEVKTEPAQEVKTEPVKEVRTEPVKEEVKAEPVQEVKAEKTTAKKATVKKSENVYIQHNGKEVSVAELLDTAKKLSEVKSPKNVSLYVKPEDNAVYYVVDGEAGKIDL